MFVVFNWQQNWMKWALKKPKKEEKNCILRWENFFSKMQKKTTQNMFQIKKKIENE